MNVVITHWEHDEDLEPGAKPPAVQAMLDWFAAEAPWGLIEATLAEEQGKVWWDAEILAGGFTYPPGHDALVEAFPTFGWENPELAIMLLTFEGDFVRVVTGTGAEMYSSHSGTYHTPAEPEAVDEGALRVAALRQSAGVCVHCGQKPRPTPSGGPE